MPSGPVLTLLAIFAATYLVRKILNFQRNIRSVDNWPGFRTLFSDRFVFFPIRAPGISPGLQWAFNTKYDDFAKAGWDVITGISLFVTPRATFYVADPAITKEVLGSRSRFPKSLEVYELLATFGSNIIVTEGDEWKRQRKIAAPAFSEKNNRLVWDETIHILKNLFDTIWRDNECVEVDNVVDLTVPITLFAISAAAFGRRISWNEDNIAPSGHSMTFKDALTDASHRLLLKVIFPTWVLRWGTTGMRKFLRAYEEIEKYLAEMVEARRTTEQKEERYDLFSSLLDANEDEDDQEAKLSYSSLIGNIFVFLVAGYETNAHTLAYAFVLLALYPDEQEAFYQNINSVLPSGKTPTYDNFSSLSYSMAVLNETLRWFPPVVNIPKQSAEDTSFTVTNVAGEKRTIPVPRGSDITICTPSLHNNPRYWDEPEAFKPARFLGNYPRDAFVPFSGGPRACIGRGFAETESVAVLTMIISRYRVEVKEEPRFSRETFEQRKARLLKCRHSLTTHPEHASLVFKRR